jgi:putative nucleotidyltransferase with HDIG domain
MKLSVDQDDFFEQLDKLAREDPPFAVRLLATANSAASSPVSPIKSIKEALTRVGAVRISSLVASMAVQRVFMPSSPSQVELWRHSIQVAVAAEAMAEIFPDLEIERGQAYLAGLLHDIGRFVMFEHAPAHLLKVDESNWHSPEKLIAADVEVFNFTHSELGYLACSRWGLPDDISEIVRRHHEILNDSPEPASLEMNILCIEIADRLALFLEQSDIDYLASDELITAIEQKCLLTTAVKNLINAQVIAERIPKIKKQSEELVAGLGLV